MEDIARLFHEDAAEIRVRAYSDRVEAIYLSATGEVRGSAVVRRGSAVAFGSATDGINIVSRAMAAAAGDALDASGESVDRARLMSDRWYNEMLDLSSRRFAEAHAARRLGYRGY